MRRGFWGKVGRSKPVIFTAAVLSILTAGLAAAGFLSASDSKGFAHESTYESYDSGFVVAQPGSYDSVDTAVVKEVDAGMQRITFMNVETGRYYTLKYDGTTVIQDKYGSGMSMEQISHGDIVDVTFLRSKKKLSGMKLSESAWVLENVEKYSFDVLGKSAEVGSGLYSIQNNLVVSSEGKDAQLEDVVRGDVLTVSGVGNSVYSVVVEEGHGYLRLSNDEYLKGGWIEVGQSVIQQITVEGAVHAAAHEEVAHVPLQLFAAEETGAQLFHDERFARGKRVRVARVDCGKMPVAQRIHRFVNRDDAPFFVDFIEQKPVLHAVFGAAEQKLPFELE